MIMTTANATSVPPRRRWEAACPRALPWGARANGTGARSAPSRRQRALGVAIGALLTAGMAIANSQTAYAQPRDGARASHSIASPRAACLEAVRTAERAHGIPEGLLVAMALNESGLHAYALNIGGRAYFPSSQEAARRLYWNAIGNSSVMAGCVQVNAGVHARRDDWPLDR